MQLRRSDLSETIASHRWRTFLQSFASAFSVMTGQGQFSITPSPIKTSRPGEQSKLYLVACPCISTPTSSLMPGTR